MSKNKCKMNLKKKSNSKIIDRHKFPKRIINKHHRFYLSDHYQVFHSTSITSNKNETNKLQNPSDSAVQQLQNIK